MNYYLSFVITLIVFYIIRRTSNIRLVQKRTGQVKRLSIDEAQDFNDACIYIGTGEANPRTFDRMYPYLKEFLKKSPKRKLKVIAGSTFVVNTRDYIKYLFRKNNKMKFHELHEKKGRGMS